MENTLKEILAELKEIKSKLESRQVGINQISHGVKTVNNEEEANRLLREGWVLIQVGFSAGKLVYLLGR